MRGVLPPALSLENGKQKPGMRGDVIDEGYLDAAKGNAFQTHRMNRGTQVNAISTAAVRAEPSPSSGCTSRSLFIKAVPGPP